MFDYIYYERQGYQTKDTPSQTLDKYKIEHDQDSGHIYLWYQDYDAEWNEDEGLFGGSIRQYNHRWVHCHDFDGKIRFYRYKDDRKTRIEYLALFKNGQLLKIEKIDNQD